MRPSDVPTYVEAGAADLGHHRQGRADRAVRARGLRAPRPRLRPLHDGARHASPARTARPRRCAASASCGSRPSTRASPRGYFERTGRQAEIVEVKGSVELAPLTGLVEAIVDLTATGTTLRENGLVVREEIAALHGAADRQPGRAQAQGRRRSTTCWSGSRASVSGSSGASTGDRRCARAAASCARSCPRRGVGHDGGARSSARCATGATPRCSTTRARFDTAAPSRGRCGSRAEDLDGALERARPGGAGRARASRSTTSARSRARALRASAPSSTLPQGQQVLRARAAGAARGGLRARRPRALPEHGRDGRVTARAAGVREVAVCAPPGRRRRRATRSILAACALCGRRRGLPRWAAPRRSPRSPTAPRPSPAST